MDYPLQKKNCVLLRFCLSPSPTLFDYSINNTPIQVLNCHRDLGILMSCDLKWSNHYKFISSRAYKTSASSSVPSLGHCHLQLKKTVPLTSTFPTIIRLSDLVTQPTKRHLCFRMHPTACHQIYPVRFELTLQRETLVPKTSFPDDAV